MQGTIYSQVLNQKARDSQLESTSAILLHRVMPELLASESNRVSGTDEVLMVAKVDRLFVPLASLAYSWFASGDKQWEVRRLGRGFSLNHVRVGRRVELRRGYSTPDSIWGTISQVVTAESLEDLYQKINFAEAIPSAVDVGEAIVQTGLILRTDPREPLGIIAFRVMLDEQAR